MFRFNFVLNLPLFGKFFGTTLKKSFSVFWLNGVLNLKIFLVLANKDLAKCILFKIEVTNTDQRALYSGTSDEKLQTRLNNHTRSFKCQSYSTDAELSKYIWKLRYEKVQYESKWNNTTYASFSKYGSKRCDLCLTEN